jgi:hypothetical protein
VLGETKPRKAEDGALKIVRTGNGGWVIKVENANNGREKVSESTGAVSQTGTEELTEQLSGARPEGGKFGSSAWRKFSEFSSPEERK